MHFLRFRFPLNAPPLGVWRAPPDAAGAIA
jgi:hypothetical protein